MMIDGALQEKPQVPKFAFYDGPQLPTLLLHGSHTASYYKEKKIPIEWFTKWTTHPLSQEIP